MRIKEFTEIYFDDDEEIIDQVGPVEGRVAIDLELIESITMSWRSKKDIDPDPKVCRVFLMSGQSFILVVKFQTMLEYWLRLRWDGVIEIETKKNGT